MGAGVSYLCFGGFRRGSFFWCGFFFFKDCHGSFYHSTHPECSRRLSFFLSFFVGYCAELGKTSIVSRLKVTSSLFIHFFSLAGHLEAVSLRERGPNGLRGTDAAGRAGGGGAARREPVEPRRRGEAEPVRGQPRPHGVPRVLREGRARLLPGVPDGLPGPQRQLGAAVHGDGLLVEEESPVEGRALRHRGRLRGERNARDRPGAAERAADGVVGVGAGLAFLRHVHGEAPEREHPAGRPALQPRAPNVRFHQDPLWTRAPQDHWNQSLHGRGGSAGGGSGHESEVRAVSVSSLGAESVSSPKTMACVLSCSPHWHCSLRSYEGDVDIDVVVKPPVTAGVKGLKLKGMLRVILEPLIGQVPLVGGVTFFFIRRPTLQVNWTGMSNLLDSPAFSSLSEETILDIIASLMVLPNRMCIPLIDQVKVDQMRFPLPRGVVRVHLLEARDLLAKDTYMMGLVKGKSDPYATLRVGNRHFTSRTIKENLHPKWNEVFEFVVHEAPGQELELELFDEDTDKDDLLGTYNLDFGEVKKEKELDRWFPLEGGESGEVHLKLQWLSLNTDSSLLCESTDGRACAMLSVYLDNASNLPRDHKEITEHQKHGRHAKEARLTRRTPDPNSFVEFSIDKDVQKSKVVFASKDPVWEEGFTFFVHNVKTQQLIVQVKAQEKKNPLGVLNLPLSRLVNTSDMTLDQRFQLEQSGANSQIKLKAILRILTVEKPPPKIVLEPPPQVNRGSNGPASAPSVDTASSPALPSNHVPAAKAPPPARAPDFSSRSNQDYLAHRRGSFLASEALRSAPPSSNMRRYDSHSLLSDNSIASSRFDLSEGASYPEAIRNHQGSFGEIHLTVRYTSLRNKLIILVNACRNLFPCSDKGTDSYVRLYLLPDQTWRHRKKTHVKKRTVNPEFNDKFEFNVPLQEAQTRKLDVAVKNSKMFHSRERKDIGMVMIDLSQMDLTKGTTEWYELSLPGLKKSS
uniref:Extended synaptotagmin-3 n=1 Tax=Scophthalmus maximus TaxID=52904 RepID=A0A8D2ZQZ5_SCOMX